MNQGDLLTELTQAHEAYEQYKKGVIVDLLSLQEALHTMSTLNLSIDEETFNEFYKVLDKTIAFIKLGEI